METYATDYAPAADEPRDALVLRVKAQLLFPHTGILHALWRFQYSWHVARRCSRCSSRPDDHQRDQQQHATRLLVARYHRLNAHEGYIDYVYEVAHCTARRAAGDLVVVTPLPNVRFRDIEFRVVEAEAADATATAKTYRQLANEREQRRADFVNDLLVRRLGTGTDERPTAADTSHAPPSSPTVDGYFFWQTERWWSEQSERCRGLAVFRRPDAAPHFDRRTVRLLNLLTRSLLVRRRAESVEQAIEVLSRASVSQVDFLHKLYVEPTASSLFAAYLSTTFMHHKQQHGLNTKHAAGKSGDGLEVSADAQRYMSKTKFDQKIYLDMCSSCDKKDIFEIMLKMPVAEHSDAPPCACDVCARLTEMANAWRYYDCTDHLWLRLEFNRRMYNSVSLLLSQRPSVRIVFFSYKNEFYEREKFIANFVNYYAFYENNEQPVGEADLHGPLREKISIIFVFAVVNWKLIVNAISSRKMHNSISLNQQSIFKSLDNTLYAIFSENSINRMAKETEQRVLDINAPYINRGFGSLPNCGVNAFTTTIG